MGKKAQSDQIKFYAVIVLSVAAAAMAYFRFVGESRPSAPLTASAPATDLYEIPELPGWMSSSPSPVPADALPYKSPQRDIFAPVAEAPPEIEAPPKTEARDAAPRAQARPRLSGILQGAKGSQAIIDGKIVRTGERVGEYTVSAISPRGVTLSSPTGRLILKVGE